MNTSALCGACERIIGRLCEPAVPSYVRGVFVGSGSDGLAEPLVCQKIIELSGSVKPVVLYIGAATYDLPGPAERQTVRFSEAGCEVLKLDVALTTPAYSTMVEATRGADVIIVSGGNTLFACDRFTRLGLTPLLRDAAQGGAVIAGGSAGAICWFDGGHSDSMDPESYQSAMLGAADAGGDESSAAVAAGGVAKDWPYIRVPCLGFLPGLVCAHHDKVQSNGILRALDFDEMLLRHAGEVGLGIDHWAALVVEAGDYSVLSLPGKPGSVLGEGEGAVFSESQQGVPGIWRKVVEGGAVQRELVPAKGRLGDLLRHATAIVEDERIQRCRAENPDEGPGPAG